jgi:hypothetical protein
MTMCCFDCGMSNKVSCCPKPVTLYGSQGQCCCIYSRCSFPCNDTAPCEVGCCGTFCINKTEIIGAAEAVIRENAGENEAVEAVIIERGAPSTVVDDADEERVSSKLAPVVEKEEMVR